MNMDRIINMVVRIIMRKAVNSGINAGIGAASGLGRKRAKDAGDAEQDTVTDDQGARQKKVRKSVGQAGKMARISRRVTRL